MKWSQLASQTLKLRLQIIKDRLYKLLWTEIIFLWTSCSQTKTLIHEDKMLNHHLRSWSNRFQSLNLVQEEMSASIINDTTVIREPRNIYNNKNTQVNSLLSHRNYRYILHKQKIILIRECRWLSRDCAIGAAKLRISLKQGVRLPQKLVWPDNLPRPSNFLILGDLIP